jgi:hypothetical protein
MDPYDIVLYGPDLRTAFSPRLSSISEVGEPTEITQLLRRQPVQHKSTVTATRDGPYVPIKISYAGPHTPCNSFESSDIINRLNSRDAKVAGLEESEKAEEETAIPDGRGRLDPFPPPLLSPQTEREELRSLIPLNKLDMAVNQHLRKMAANRPMPGKTGRLQREISKKRAANTESEVGGLAEKIQEKIREKAQERAHERRVHERAQERVRGNVEENVEDNSRQNVRDKAQENAEGNAEGNKTGEAKADNKKVKEGKMKKVAKMFRFWY